MSCRLPNAFLRIIGIINHTGWLGGFTPGPARVRVHLLYMEPQNASLRHLPLETTTRLAETSTTGDDRTNTAQEHHWLWRLQPTLKKDSDFENHHREKRKVQWENIPIYLADTQVSLILLSLISWLYIYIFLRDKCDTLFTHEYNKAIRDGKYLAPPHASVWQRLPH